MKPEAVRLFVLLGMMNIAWGLGGALAIVLASVANPIIALEAFMLTGFTIGAIFIVYPFFDTDDKP